MIPTNGGCLISPTKTKVVGDAEFIPARIKCCEETVLVSILPTHLGIDIIKVNGVFIVGQFQKSIYIRSASRHDERTLIFSQWAFYHQARSQCSYTSASCKFFIVAIL